MRFCNQNGALDMQCKQTPANISDPELLPWFRVKNRKPLAEPVIFGHWAALNGVFEQRLYGLDTGCVWGGQLTMINWKKKQLFSQSLINKP